MYLKSTFGTVLTQVLSYNEIVGTKLHSRLHPLLWVILLLAASVSCSSRRTISIPLASFTENDVDVSIRLEHPTDDEYVLVAEFTPPHGYHLYSKDIPATGIGGLGRPTRLELTTHSLMKAAGPLTESAEPQVPDFEPEDLLVYPLGPVTLSLPVDLPPGADWINDELSVTYMACSSVKCKPPVEGKVIPVRIPDVDAVDAK